MGDVSIFRTNTLVPKTVDHGLLIGHEAREDSLLGDCNSVIPLVDKFHLLEVSPLRSFTSWKFHLLEVSFVRQGAKESRSLKISPSFISMAESDCYSTLIRMTLSEADLERYHFPRPHPFIMNKAVIFDIKNSYFTVPPGPYLRTCKRCFKVYFINNDGLPAVVEECLYHPFKLRKGRFPLFPCCQGSPGAPPCTGAPFHISKDIDPDNLNGFISTRCNGKVTTRNVYAIDCEMVCTKAGLEIASISIVNSECELVYEAMILPDNPVHDYLTEYSRLTDIAFVGVTMKLGDLHRKLLELFGEQTILVGHGLYSDLLYLKLFHNNIIDTMILYSDDNFVPSLAVLKERFIPPSESSKSFSKCREDAEAAMKLALLKCQGIKSQEKENGAKLYQGKHF